MDLEELFLMESTFRVAKKRGIPSYVMGCGIGPLFKRRYICLVKNIFTMASKIALRDKESVQLAKELYGERLGQKIVYLGDPAIISIERFKKENDAVPNLGQIAINLREYPRSVYHHDSVLKDSDYEQLLKNLSSEYENVYLVPMLDFAAGYDDRRYLSRISLHTSCSNVHVLHHPLGLKGLYNLYMNSYGCIGMRHHSVVMQTILNGNNYIIDYTEPKRGKTQGFINSIDRDGFYDFRTLNIQCGEKSDLEKVGSILKTGKRFVWKESTIKEDYSLWLNM